MDKKQLVTDILIFVAGMIAGYAGSKLLDKKNASESVSELKEESVSSEDDSDISVEEYKEKVTTEFPADLATPKKPGIDYTKYSKLVEQMKYNAESESPKEEDDDSDDISDEDLRSECVETYEERLERESKERTSQQEAYVKKHGNEIKPITIEEATGDFREVDYPIKTLYYYCSDDPNEDDILTDEEGERIDDIEGTLGQKFKRFGFGVAAGDDEIYIRNNPLETDFHVLKRMGTPDMW